jgi:RimJ/RimL family protein N-acetyltransferase
MPRIPDPCGESDAREFLVHSEKGWEEGTFYGFAVAEGTTGRLIGSIGVSVNGAIGEVGYFVFAGYRRLGIGERALRLISHWALQELSLARLQLKVIVGNTASAELAEKAGFKREGVLRANMDNRGVPVDVIMHSLLPGDIERDSGDEQPSKIDGEVEPAVLSDGIVSLRFWRDSDLGAAVEICQDAEIMRWTTAPSPYGEEDYKQFLKKAQRSFEAGTAYEFAVVDTPGGALIGSTRLSFVGEGIGEVGYFVGAGFRRKGIGKRAVKLISHWALDDLKLARLQITVFVENTASQRLAEAAGYRREGVLRSWLGVNDARVDIVMYSLLPGEIDRLSGDE